MGKTFRTAQPLRGLDSLSVAAGSSGIWLSGFSAIYHVPSSLTSASPIDSPSLPQEEYKDILDLNHKRADLFGFAGEGTSVTCTHVKPTDQGHHPSVPPYQELKQFRSFLGPELGLLRTRQCHETQNQGQQTTPFHTASRQHVPPQLGSSAMWGSVDLYHSYALSRWTWWAARWVNLWGVQGDSLHSTESSITNSAK